LLVSHKLKLNVLQIYYHNVITSLETIRGWLWKSFRVFDDDMLIIVYWRSANHNPTIISLTKSGANTVTLTLNSLVHSEHFTTNRHVCAGLTVSYPITRLIHKF